MDAQPADMLCSSASVAHCAKPGPPASIDVLFASDCIYRYNPDLHVRRMPPFSRLLRQLALSWVSYSWIRRVYSYHSNVTSQRVEEFFATAEEYDFRLISEFTKRTRSRSRSTYKSRRVLEAKIQRERSFTVKYWQIRTRSIVESE